MAATKYQVLYRYMNEATNNPITNNANTEYEEICEFYQQGHKLFCGDDSDKNIAEDEKQEMISNGNTSDNVKTDMLFSYTGTQKLKRKIFVPKETGYVVRNWKSLDRTQIGNRGDFSKNFTTLNAPTPEDGGTVVCTQSVFESYLPAILTITTTNEYADAGTDENPYFTSAGVFNLIEKTMPFALASKDNYTDYTTPCTEISIRIGYDSYGRPIYGSYYNGPVAIGANNMAWIKQGSSATVWGQWSRDNLYASIRITRSQIQTIEIPEHYIEDTSYPYLIKDVYTRIKLSPWFVNATFGSLERAIQKAKTLVEMIGMENVKVIKIVPFDQFIKIK